MNVEVEKSELSLFERFLYFFFIPIVFGILLIAGLLSFFGVDIMSAVLKEANKIPIIGTILPEPKVVVKKGPQPINLPEEKIKSQDQQLVALNRKVSDQEQLLKSAEAASVQKEQSIKDLQTKTSALEEQLKTKTRTEAEYDSQIQQTASMFVKMNPSKAAPIMENFTLKERVLLLSQMKPDDRVKILEKMDPKKAAEATIYLKDVVPVKDREIAALQERIKLNDDVKNTQKLTATDLGQTFSNMPPKSAADILILMNAATPTKVLDILNAMDNQGRSKVVAAIADLNKQLAASISAKLIP